MNSQEIKYSLERRVSVPPDQLTSESLRNAGCLDRVCLLPENFNERASYLGDVLVQMLTRAPKDDNLRAFVGKLTLSLSYMLNSTSWQEGELFDFDVAEIKRKLGSLL
jgi:hypothetical protein